MALTPWAVVASLRAKDAEKTCRPCQSLKYVSFCTGRHLFYVQNVRSSVQNLLTSLIRQNTAESSVSLNRISLPSQGTTAHGPIGFFEWNVSVVGQKDRKAGPLGQTATGITAIILSNQQYLDEITVACPKYFHFRSSSVILSFEAMVLRCWRSHIMNTPFVEPIAHFVAWIEEFNPLSPELNPICYLLALLAHHFLHVSRIRVKSLTLR